MSKSKQEKLSRPRGSAGWGVAIERAERGIIEARQRIEKLERSIEVFRECEKRGEPWPGTAKSSGQIDSQQSNGG